MNEDSTRTKRMTKECWLALHEEWKAGGESQKLFCKRKEINPHTFSYWRNKHNSKQNSQPKNAFSPVRLTETNSSSFNGIRIILRNGAHILIPPNYNPTELKSFLELVGIVAC